VLEQHPAPTGLTFRGWQTSPFRLLSIFSAETEVDFLGVFYYVYCILRWESIAPAQRAESLGTQILQAVRTLCSTTADYW